MNIFLILFLLFAQNPEMYTPPLPTAPTGLKAVVSIADGCPTVDVATLPGVMTYQLPSWVTALTFTSPANVMYLPAHPGQPNQSITIPADDAVFVSSIVGNSYCIWLEAGGGVPPYTFSAAGLPPGLTLNSSGDLHGVTTIAGNYKINFKVQDSKGAVATVQTQQMQVCAVRASCMTTGD